MTHSTATGMPRRSLFFSLSLVCALGLGGIGCKTEAKQDLTEDEKQARVQALLRQSGADTTATETGNAPVALDTPPAEQAPGQANGQVADRGTPSPTSAQSPSATSDTSQPAAAAGETPLATDQPANVDIKLISAGQAPKQKLSYNFKKGRNRKFALDMEIAPTRTVNGQPAPGMPPIALSVTGASTTVDVLGGVAQRRYIFTNLVPSVEGAPPEALQQMKAQFDTLKGLELLERVSTTGRVEALDLEQAMMNPQVLGLMQYLTDGMTNAFVPLPKEAVGVGAKWVASTTIENAGLRVTQENTISIVSLIGSKAVVEMSYKQSAPAQEVKSPNLPPGVKVEITGLSGTGSGKMSTDFDNFIVDSKVDLSMVVNTQVTQPGAPAPLKESGETKMRAHVRVTE